MNAENGAIRLAARAIDGTTRAGYMLALAILALVAIITCYEVAARYFFGAPTRWVNDYVAYALCLIIFLAVPELTRTRAHIAISFLVDGAPPRRARIMRVVIAMLGTLACLAAAWISAEENWRQYVQGEETIATIPIPKWWISIFITYGMLGAGIQFGRQTLDPPAAPPSFGT